MRRAPHIFCQCCCAHPQVICNGALDVRGSEYIGSMYIHSKALDDEYESRLILFSVIEPGHTGWSQEINRVGAATVLQGLLNGEYDSKTCTQLIREIELTNSELLQTAVSASNSEFIYPGHLKWPKQVDQLSNPPIGLIVRGQTCNSICWPWMECSQRRRSRN